VDSCVGGYYFSNERKKIEKESNNRPANRETAFPNKSASFPDLPFGERG